MNVFKALWGRQMYEEDCQENSASVDSQKLMRISLKSIPSPDGSDDGYMILGYPRVISVKKTEN